MNFMQGTLDVLILTALSGGPRHGYEVVDWIRAQTRGEIEIDDGALYTSLHRMEKRGWLGHEWLVSPKGRRAKYYHLTREGRHHLQAGQRSWRRFATAVTRLFDARQRA